MIKAYVLLGCNTGSEEKIISELRKIPKVIEVHGTLGTYDIVLKIETEAELEIDKVVSNIRKIDGISSTMTLKSTGDDTMFGTDKKLTSVLLGQNTAQAYVVIHSEYGEEFNVLKNISKLMEVKEASAVFGLYDVICKIEASTHKELETIIIKSIRKLPHMKTSMTLNVISEQ